MFQGTIRNFAVWKIILKHAWLNVWDKHMITGMINLVFLSLVRRDFILSRTDSSETMMSCEFARPSIAYETDTTIFLVKNWFDPVPAKLGPEIVRCWLDCLIVTKLTRSGSGQARARYRTILYGSACKKNARALRKNCKNASRKMEPKNASLLWPPDRHAQWRVARSPPKTPQNLTPKSGTQNPKKNRNSPNFSPNSAAQKIIPTSDIFLNHTKLGEGRRGGFDSHCSSSYHHHHFIIMLIIISSSYAHHAHHHIIVIIIIMLIIVLSPYHHNVQHHIMIIIMLIIMIIIIMLIIMLIIISSSSASSSSSSSCSSFHHHHHHDIKSMRKEARVRMGRASERSKDERGDARWHVKGWSKKGRRKLAQLKRRRTESDGEDEIEERSKERKKKKRRWSWRRWEEEGEKCLRNVSGSIRPPFYAFFRGEPA